MKKLILAFACCSFLFTATAKQNRIDSLAIYILDRMTGTMQSIESCSFSVETSYDVFQQDLGYIKHSTNDKVFVKYPDKLRMALSGDQGRRDIFYNGKKFSYYSLDKNQCSEIETSGNVLQLFENISKKYGVEFPAADFFYPDFTDDLIQTGGNLIYLGITKVNGKDCFHIAGNDVNGTGFQFWIADDENFLPVKMVLVYKTDDGQPQYEATYSDWKLNPSLQSALFEFVAPPTSTKVKMQPIEKLK
jgi:hypothetical protein